MKKYNIFILSALLLIIGCKKQSDPVVVTESTLDKATFQVFNGTVRAARNYVYANGAPVTGAALAFGGVFPSSAYGSKVNPGATAIFIKDTAANATQAPLAFSQNMDAGKSYTIFTYDTTTNIKQITVENKIVVINDTTATLRFANFIYNTTSVPNVDVYSFRKIPGVPVMVGGNPVFNTSTPVFSNIATNTITDFIPYFVGLSDTFYVYATGTITPLIAKQVVSSFTPKRGYTSVYSGSFKGTKAVTTFVNY